MSNVLYTVALSRHVRGCVKGPVGAVPANGLLFDVDAATGELVVPDIGAVKECLPACYRAAFDRSAALSQTKGRYGFHVTLYSSRGRWLNVIYLMPARHMVNTPIA